MSVLDLPWISAIRHNHALEHATVHVLTRRFPYVDVVGRSGSGGFVIYGVIETEALEQAAQEALARLQAGERHLAVHPRCGTQLSTAGTLAGLAAFGAMLGKSESRWDKLPGVLLATTLAVIAAQPIGLRVQKQITTAPDMEGVRITGITRQERGHMVIHRVKVQHAL
jgi:hypothetical protein